MYYENPEVNDDRQYADFCLDRNGKSILKDEVKESFLINKRNIEKAAQQHQNCFITHKGDSTMDGYANGKKKQSYDSFMDGAYFILKHIKHLIIDFAEYHYSYRSLSDYSINGKTDDELLKQFTEGRNLTEIKDSEVGGRRAVLSMFAVHYNKLNRNDYIGEDDIDDFILTNK